MSAVSDAGVRYRDKVTIVTGGSRGIGQACVEVYVRHGSKVVFCDLREELGVALESRLIQGFPGEAKFVKCDVTKEEDIKRLIQTALDTYGQIDCVINNAGLTQGVKTVDTLTAEEFRQMNEVNLIAPFQVSKFAMPHLRKTKGNIINMCSMSGVVGQGKSIAYTPTKYIGRLGEPEEIALACLYLATDATYSTGLNLFASGGAELDYGFKAKIERFLD